MAKNQKKENENLQEEQALNNFEDKNQDLLKKVYDLEQQIKSLTSLNNKLTKENENLQTKFNNLIDANDKNQDYYSYFVDFIGFNGTNYKLSSGKTLQISNDNAVISKAIQDGTISQVDSRDIKVIHLQDKAVAEATLEFIKSKKDNSQFFNFSKKRVLLVVDKIV